MVSLYDKLYGYLMPGYNCIQTIIWIKIGTDNIHVTFFFYRKCYEKINLSAE